MLALLVRGEGGGGGGSFFCGCCVGLQRMNEDAWCVIHRLVMCSHTHMHAYTAYIHLHVIRIPHVSGTFRCYQMKKLYVRALVRSEEGPGGCVTYS